MSDVIIVMSKTFGFPQPDEETTTKRHKKKGEKEAGCVLGEGAGGGSEELVRCGSGEEEGA